MNESKSILAKLLAKENITVRYGNYHTASFDVQNRILCLPMWKYDNKGLLDMLVGHEVGHALYTPAEGWHDCEIEVPGIPRAFINIVEDIRIEKKIQRQYPGLVRSFKQGYTHLFENDFFEIAGKDISSMSFMNRLNIKSKLRDLVEVPFNAIEQQFVDMAMNVETWDDVLNVCKALLEFAEQEDNNETEELQSAEAQAPSSGQDQDAESQTEDFGSADEDGGDDTDTQQQMDTDQNNGSDADADQHPSGYGQDSDGDKTENNQKQLGGQEGSRELADSPLTNKKTHRVETDEALRRNESKLLDTDEAGAQPKIVNGFRKEQLSDMLVSYKEVMASRQKVMEANPGGYKYDVSEHASDFTEFMAETKKVTSVMAKEFEMRKAAYQYSRAQTARSGSLDVNKLHSYKYNDDIFSRVTKLADAKSHGMIMLVDYSGSMHGIMGSVIKQILNLSTFCKKVNIPFEVYGFTNGKWENAKATLLPGDIDHRDVRIFNLLSSSMTKTDYDTAFFQMFMQTCGYGMPYGNFCGEYDQLGGTPLNESLVAMPHIVQQFKSRHPVQRVINVIITDGDAQYMYTKEDASTVRTRGTAVSINNKIVKAFNNHDLTVKLTDNLRSLGCTNVGFFLAERRYDSNRAISRATGSWDQESFRSANKMLNKNKFASYDDTLGYDRFFVVKADRRTLDTDTEDFAIRENATKGEITRAFKKFANSKKGNRVLAAQFAQMVA